MLCLEIAPYPCMLDHSPTLVTRTLPSGSPRTETLSSRAAAYKPERNRLRLRSSVPMPANVEVLTNFQPVNTVRNLAVLARLLDAWTDVGVSQRDAVFVAASKHRQLGRQGRNRGRQSSCAAADRRRWTGCRSLRNRRVALLVRTFPLRTKGRRGFPRRDCINLGVSEHRCGAISAARTRFRSARRFAGQKQAL